MGRHEITFAGVGGQGLMSAGNILCLAAVTFANVNAVMTSEYGTETRGTFAKSDVIISEDRISYPEIEESSLVLCLSPIAFKRYEDSENKDLVVVYDSDCVEPREDAPYKQVGVPFSTISKDNGRIPVNMIALGYITAMTGCVEDGHVYDALKFSYGEKPKLLKKNLKGYQTGTEIYRTELF